MSPESPDQRQRRAADPNHSVWLDANAGSGKTRVLIDRVSRLLFDGVDPGHILCVTYTRAAAAEMQNRLFDRLSGWAMASTADLHQALTDLGIERPLAAEDLAEARRLFAKAVEVPGGLKIQTFHAFAASVLRRFPREAGVAPDFIALDDHGARSLMADILDAMALDAATAPLLRNLAEITGCEDLEKLAAEVAAKTPAGVVWPDRAGVFAAYGLAPDTTTATLLAQVVGADKARLEAIAPPLLQQGGATDKKFGEAVMALDKRHPDAALRGLEKHGLVQKDMTAKIGKLPTAKLRDGALAGDMGWINAFLTRIEETRPRRLALHAAERSTALIAFARAFTERYQRAKLARGAVDFSDQIALLSRLLTTPALKDFVLWRLDGQIEHILVDEAQDTAAAPWEALQALTAEFTAGIGAHDRPRKLFVVGDPKQSIYRFQGADAARFDEERQRFQAQMSDAGDPLREVVLAHSFRSSPAILRAVDAVFARIGWPNCQHLAFWDSMPGRVDLWPPLLASGDKPEEGEWWEPLDALSDAHPTRVLAQTIATRLGQMLAGETLPTRIKDREGWHHRPIRAGDIMILVQRRSTMFAELLQACKKAGLPVAGADRLQVGAELAVRDLMALCHAVATPRDDLSLAAVLRSPLLGWSEQELFDLAAKRPAKTSLRRALRSADSAKAKAALALLDDLGAHSDFLRPFDLLERVLIRHEGRAKLLGRLGAEAADGIDALLAEAMAYERDHVPSLTGYLAWAETEEREIKRQFSDKEDLIRIMTVHGAKGLERPIVILPDTMRLDRPTRDQVLSGDEALPLAWKSPSDQASALDERLLAQDREAEEAERKRLLYVAMTRAESWLIVAGAGGVQSKPDADWYGDVTRGLEGLDCAPLDIAGLDGEGRRFAFGPWQSGEALPKTHLADQPPALPPALLERPKPFVASPQHNASDLGGAKALPSDSGEAEDIAIARGRATHLLLERLPRFAPDQRPAQARAMLAETALPAALVEPVIAESLAVLDDPTHADLFGPDVFSEVPLSATLAELGGARLRGVLDKAMVAANRVVIVDFKTNRAVPPDAASIPEGITRQMAAYAAAAAAIWPDHEICCEILWTVNRQRMAVPAEQMAAALRRAADDSSADTAMR